MKRLILHIGTHKTGTTAIQTWLEGNRANLSEHGFWYATTDRPPDANLPVHSSLFWSLVRDDLDYETEVKLILDEFAASGCETLILSCEGLSQNTPKPFQSLRGLADLFEVTTVCVLRRQDLFLESMWNQYSKIGVEKLPLAEFVRQPRLRRRTRYSQVLDFYSEFSTVKTLTYQDTVKSNIVATFSKLCGLPHDGAQERIHTSPSMNCAALCNLLNRRGTTFNRAYVLELFRGDRREHALGRDLRTEVLAENEEENFRLAERYGVCFDDWMPDEPAGPLVYPSAGSLARAGLNAVPLFPKFLRHRRTLRSAQRTSG